MPFAEVNGQHIFFEDSGGNGAPVIFSHGFLMDHEMFAPQVEALADDFRCITWDERGFGQTPASGPFTYYDSASDCLALLGHLGIDQAVLAGMSQGGFLSLRAALTAPDRVKALVLIDTQSGTEDPGGPYRLRRSCAMNGSPMARAKSRMSSPGSSSVVGTIRRRGSPSGPGPPTEWFAMPTSAWSSVTTYPTVMDRDYVPGHRVPRRPGPAIALPLPRPFVRVSAVVKISSSSKGRRPRRQSQPSRAGQSPATGFLRQHA